MKKSEALALAGSAGRGSNRDLEKLLRGIVGGEVPEPEDPPVPVPPAPFQADLSDSADGEAIAAAVNGLRDVLVSAGIMESE